MNRKDLFGFYKELYFFEADRREKLSLRLNVPLAVIVGLVGFMSYMLENVPENMEGFSNRAFWSFFTFAGVAIAVALWNFRKAWFGHSDKLLPTAIATEEYRDTLVEMYKDYDECDELVEAALEQYLYRYYMEYSSVNAINNDSRSYHLYLATASITAAIVLAFVAFLPFYSVSH